MLSQLPDEVTERSERIGRNLAVALQAFIELQPFIEENHFDSDLSLGSAPVLFHLQNDSKLLDYIGTCEGDIDNLDLKKVSFAPPDLKKFVKPFGLYLGYSSLASVGVRSAAAHLQP
jgi:hypothetical protein